MRRRASILSSVTVSSRPGLFAVLVASGLCLLTGGCGGGGAPKATTTTVPPATSAPTSTSTTTAAPGPAAPCTTAQLSVTIGAATTAAGTRQAPFVVANRAAAPCSLSGYFGLALVNARGLPVGPSPTQQPALVGAAGTPSGLVVVTGAATARFLFEWDGTAAPGQTCPPATSVELTAPGQTDHVTLAARTGDGTVVAPCSASTQIGPVTASG